MREYERFINREDHDHIVTCEYPLIDFPDSSAGNSFRRLASRINRNNAPAIAFKLHNNSYVAYDTILGGDRPSSAFYYAFEGTLTIALGPVRESGDAVIHEDLRNSHHYKELIQRGAKVRSGHVGYITLPNQGERIHVALLDALGSRDPVNPNQLEYAITATLIQNGFVALTSDGFPVEIQGLSALPETIKNNGNSNEYKPEDIAAFVARLRATRKAKRMNSQAISRGLEPLAAILTD